MMLGSETNIDSELNIVIEQKNELLFIILNMDKKNNALNMDCLNEISRILKTAEKDDGVRVLVLTANGRSFCAGADIVEVAGPNRDNYLELWHSTLAALRTFPKPTIGAIQGLVVAGGLELAMCCDLLIASDAARIADAHILLGLIPGAGGATILPQRIGLARARQLLLTGDFEPATTLCQWGLINWVVPAGELMQTAQNLAAKISAFSPVALVKIKMLTAASVPSELLALEAATMRLHLQTPDAITRMEAFLSHRAAASEDASTPNRPNPEASP